MKKTLLFFVFFSCLSIAFSQEKYSRVKIYTDDNGLRQLTNAGVTIDHGNYRKDVWFISDFSEKEIQLISQSGFPFEVMIDDVQQHYIEQNFKSIQSKTATAAAATCNLSDSLNYNIPTNFTLGSMGGYFTYNEFLAHLDTMAAKYPNLITTRQPIDTIITHNGYPIYWLKISDNPTIDENEPEVLYTALHHAREPASLSQLIFYMYYILENYASNSEIQQVVDNTEMYFIPMVNPDGYIHNYNISPNGGGMWRKNRRNNGGGDFGVDLNRNYSYQWGFSGASTDPGNDTYMGTSSFSEPETQAVKYFSENHNFKFAFNYHTFGNLLLFPFGYDNVPTVDDAYFKKFTVLMVEENNYANIQSVDLYPAAGDSDDWLYGDTSTKPKIFAMTPEVGPDADGFWPSSNRIIDLCKNNVHQNFMLAKLAGKFASTEDLSASVINNTAGYFQFNIQRLGLDSPSSFTVEIIPLGNEISSIGSPKTFSSLALMKEEVDSISFTLDTSLQNGQQFSFVLIVDNGLYLITDTITKSFGTTTVTFADDGNSMNNWNSVSWDVTTNDFYTSPSSITDSPQGDYSNNATTSITLSDKIDLTDSNYASLSFWAKWDIEAGYDYVQVLATSNDTDWFPLCGKHTKPGTAEQDEGNPLFDGTQSLWVKEEMDLSDFLGDSIKIKFILISDVWKTGDGFYFDDLKVEIMKDEPDTTTGTTAIPEYPIEISVSQNIPNPAYGYTSINYALPPASKATLYIYNALGERVITNQLDPNTKTLKINTSELHTGVYFYRISSKDFKSKVRKMIIVK
ncbi:MAG: hypothetical protein COA57_16180 [Flavobacteriales bacterium]|nr:MAG: hypothetical protein COA57_16180 [Flavobacteriales bacterium]